MMSNICHFVKKNVTILGYNEIKNLSTSSCLYGHGENVKNALFAPFQKEPPKITRKITVVGVGWVGTSIISALTRLSCCDELLLLDIPSRQKKVCGDVYDFCHANRYFHSPKIYASFKPEDTKDSDLIILTCGTPRKTGQTRRDLSQANVNLMKTCIPALAKNSPDAVFLVITVPIEAVSYAVWKYSGFPKSRVIGLGTSIDVNRFRYYVSTRIPVNPYSIDAHAVGEHGDAGIPVWSTLNIAGTNFRDLDPNIGIKEDTNKWIDIWTHVKKAGDNLVKMKGSTGASVGLLTASLSRDILQDSGIVRFVAIHAKGYLDIKTESFMSFPAVIGNRGVSKIVNMSYESDELSAIKKCSDELDKVWKSIKF